MWRFAVGLLLMPAVAVAQSVPMSSEDVAPLALKRDVAPLTVSAGTAVGAPVNISASAPVMLNDVLAVTPTAVVPAAPVALPVAVPASPTFVESYFVPGLTIELPAAGVSSTLRDQALVQAARAGLSRVLGNTEPPLDIATQTRLVANTADPMSLVKSYRIADEVLMPSYTLTVDMTYQPQAVMDLLPKPGAVPQPGVNAATLVSQAMAISGTAVGSMAVSASVPVVPAITVRVSGNAGAQDKVMKTLKAMGLAATYSRLTVDGAELSVANASADTLAAQLRAKGMAVDASPDGSVDIHF